jgi:hypothetical protein
VVSAAAAGRGGSIEERKRGNEKSKKVFLVFELSFFPFSSSHFFPSPEAEAVLASRYAALLCKKISSVSSYSRS